MEKKFKLEFTESQLNVVFQALLEMPAKYSLSVIDEIKKQVGAINTELKEESKTE